MKFERRQLYELLPAVYRSRDEELGGPLAALCSVIAEQIAVLDDDLDRLYDDQFIETCADWAVPYIGDLIGWRALHGVVAAVSSPRAEVANTIAYRRRKGTAAMLEQLARDVTGWNARVVEFFQLLATTQFMNHLRPHNFYSPDLRRWEPLERLNTPFDEVAHTADVRRVASRRGKYNIPNVGIFLWRIDAYPLTATPAARVDDRRWRFSPLGHDAPLFTRPAAEAAITHLAEPINVPAPLSRRILGAHLDAYYGPGLSLSIVVNDSAVARDQVRVCNLSDGPGNTWVHLPADDKYAIDPELGRLALPASAVPANLRVSFHYGFSAPIGGGEYDRAASVEATSLPVEQVPSPNADIQSALDALPSGGGVVEITGSQRFEETPAISIATPNGRLDLRSSDSARPAVVMSGNLQVTGPGPQGDTVPEAELTIDGLVFAGGAIQVLAAAAPTLRRLRLRHCTLVPGRSLSPNGEPVDNDAPSLVVEAPIVLDIDRCIVGRLAIARGAQIAIRNSIVDATDETNVAFSGSAADPTEAGGTLSIENSTIIGRIHTVNLKLASNSILLAAGASGDTTPPVLSERKQDGCVRFSYVPPGSQVPRRYRCQPESAAADTRVRPQLTSRRYGHPAYCQLAFWCAPEITRGADDEAEMGGFHDLFQPQRETNLRVRLEEYLRFGLEAGVFYAS